MQLKRIRVLTWTCLALLSLFSLRLSGAQARPQTNTVTVQAEIQTTNQVHSVATEVTQLEKEVVMSFGLEQIPFLQPALFGTPRWKYVASLIFILLAFGIAKLLDWIVGGWLYQWASKIPGRSGEVTLRLVHGPVKIVSFVILLHIGLEALSWPAQIQKWLSKGLEVIVACSLTYMVLNFIDVLVDYWRQRTPAKDDRLLDDHLFPVLNKTLKAFILIVAVLVTCQNLGLDVTAMLASLSIGGLALGLAAQDTVANLFGAVAVFVDKPFKVGDRIKLDTIDGTVESIGLRSTRIRNLDGHLITVPNKTMGNATITNVTRRPNIKTELNIGITYDTPADKVRDALRILEEIYRKHPATQDVLISFNKFADSALNINVIHWWGNTDYRAYVAGMQELNLLIKQRFDQEGIEFAFPTQTLYMKQNADGAASFTTPLPAPAAQRTGGISAVPGSN
jgi:MscS family membrane protein